VRKRFGEEFVIFNRASGSTHLVNSVANGILSILERRPSSAQELSLQVATEIRLESDEEIVERIEVVLEALENLGLIESLPQ